MIYLSEDVSNIGTLNENMINLSEGKVIDKIKDFINRARQWIKAAFNKLITTLKKIFNDMRKTLRDSRERTRENFKEEDRGNKPRERNAQTPSKNDVKSPNSGSGEKENGAFEVEMTSWRFSYEFSAKEFNSVIYDLDLERFITKVVRLISDTNAKIELAMRNYETAEAGEMDIEANEVRLVIKGIKRKTDETVRHFDNLDGLVKEARGDINRKFGLDDAKVKHRRDIIPRLEECIKATDSSATDVLPECIKMLSVLEKQMNDALGEVMPFDTEVYETMVGLDTAITTIISAISGLYAQMGKKCLEVAKYGVGLSNTRYRDCIAIISKFDKHDRG